MALTKQIENDKIEVVTSLKTIQIRQKTTILEDGKALSASFHRRCIEPGYLDDSDNYVKSDVKKFLSVNLVPTCIGLSKFIPA